MLVHNKKSKYWYATKHQNVESYLGYKYHNNVYKNTLSPELYYSNSKTQSFIDKLEILIDFLIDSVKNIKLQYSIAHDKNDTNIK